MRRIASILWKDFREYYAKAPTLSWGILFPVTLVVLFGYYSGGIGSYRVMPSLLAISLMFAATTMPHVALSFDRMNGGLTLLLSSPVGVWEILTAKLLGGIIWGLAGVLSSAALLWAIAGAAPFIHPWWAVAAALLGAVLFSSLGLLVSLLFEPVQAVASLNFLRFTMVFLGGMLPRAALPGLVGWLAYAFPIAYIGDMFRYGMFNIYEYADPATSLASAAIYTVGLLVVSVVIAEKRLVP